MIVRPRDLGRLRRAAGASLALPPLDPADVVAQLLGDADVVILALRDMEMVAELEAVWALAAARVGEELGVGFARSRRPRR